MLGARGAFSDSPSSVQSPILSTHIAATLEKNSTTRFFDPLRVEDCPGIEVSYYA
jgi:hypothetical protein